MNWNKLRDDVHENAIKHGWWDEPRTFGETLALIHSEVSEALEEYRAGREKTWHACMEGEGESACNPRDTFDCLNYGNIEACKHRCKKPEGLYVELADCIIRILDYFGEMKIDSDFEKELPPGSCTEPTFGDFISALHMHLSRAYQASRGKGTAFLIETYLKGCVCEIIFWTRKNNIDIESIILEKHIYNQTRPYRHGGKRL